MVLNNPQGLIRYKISINQTAKKHIEQQYENLVLWNKLLIFWKKTKKKKKKKLDGSYAKMLRAILNKSWRQHSTKQQLYCHHHPSRKLSKLDEPNMQDTAGEVGTSSGYTPMDPFTWPCKSSATGSNLHTAVLRGYGV